MFDTLKYPFIITLFLAIIMQEHTTYATPTSDALWHNVFVQFKGTVENFFEQHDITEPFLNMEKNQFIGSLLGKVASSYHPSSNELNAVITHISNLFQAFSTQATMYYVNNANNFSNLYAATINGNHCILGCIQNSNTLTPIYEDGSVRKTLSVPTTYGTIQKTALIPSYNNNNDVDNFWFASSGSYLVNYNLSTQSIITQKTYSFNEADILAQTNPALQYINGKLNALFSASSDMIFYLTKNNQRNTLNNVLGTDIGSNLTVINSLNTMCSDNQNNYWAACTANNSNNGLYKFPLPTSGNFLQGPTALTPIAMPINGQKVSYLKSDANGAPVIITYSNLIYTLNSDGSVLQSYNLASMLSISTPTIAPTLACDTHNNYWVCINGTTLVCINTSNNTATSYDLTFLISQIPVYGSALTSITPRDIAVDFKGNPWMAITEAPYIIKLNLQ